MSNSRLDTYYKVGLIDESWANLVGFNYFGQVYAAPGLIKHIQKRHGFELGVEILNNLIDIIRQVVESPDYIGHHPDKAGEAIELVKRFSDNIMIGIEVDPDDKYIYVATLHPIPEHKIQNRLNSGRLVELTKPLEETLKQISADKK